MSSNSSIEWTDASWTPIRARPRSGEKLVGDPGWQSARPGGRPGWYCEHISDGCSNCYAEAMNRRLGTGIDFKRQNRERVEIFLDEEMLLAPLRWKKPRMIFVCSMTDLLADFVKDEWIDKLFAVMALCPQHTFQVLTKRAERMQEYVSKYEGCAQDQAFILLRDQNGSDAAHAWNNVHGEVWPLPNVWIGVSCERQQEFNERWPLLRGTPAAIRFISYEPALGRLDACEALGVWLRQHPDNSLTWQRARTFAETRPDWFICGGESGRNARPMHPDWARSLRDQCKAAGVKFFFKQWGEHIAETVPGTNVDLKYDLKPNQSVACGDGKTNHTRYTRVGKKAAGRLLDGREHNEFPSVV